MKVKVVREQSGTSILLQAERPAPSNSEIGDNEVTIASAGSALLNMTFASIYTTVIHKRCACVSSRRQQELPSHIGIGIVIIANERQAHIDGSTQDEE
jgi:hypothetical protein